MRYLILLVTVLFAAAAAAQDAPTNYAYPGSGCIWNTICSQAATGPCVGPTPLTIVQRAKNYNSHSVFTNGSTASAWSCDVYTADRGYSATVRQKVSSSPLTETAQVWSASGLLGDIWLECATVTAGTITATYLACQ